MPEEFPGLRGLKTVRISQRSITTVLWFMFSVAPLCSAGNITYNVNLTVGSGSVTGFIETDGTLGNFNDVESSLFDASKEILDWNLLLNDGTQTFDLLGPLSDPAATDFVSYNGAGVEATATDLLFDYSADSSGGELEFTDGPDRVCIRPAAGCIDNEPGGISILVGDDYPNVQFFSQSAGTVVIGTASGTNTPEPSPLVLWGLGVGAIFFRRALSRHSTTGIICLK